MNRPPDAHRECDLCHFICDVWLDDATIDCGDFEYCISCWKSMGPPHEQLTGDISCSLTKTS